jgi:hypothetical protein
MSQLYIKPTSVYSFTLPTLPTLPTAFTMHTTTYYILHTTYYILHTTYYILHTTYYILHVVECGADIRAEEIKAYIVLLEKQLGVVIKSAEALIRRDKESSLAMFDFSQGMGVMGVSEGEGIGVALNEVRGGVCVCVWVCGSGSSNSVGHHIVLY